MPCVYNNKFVIIEQEKIVLQKDSLEAGLDLLKLCFDSAPGHQNQIMPRFCGAFSFELGNKVSNSRFKPLFTLWLIKD